MDDKVKGRDRAIAEAMTHVGTAEVLLNEAHDASNDQTATALALRAIGHLMLARAMHDEWR